jgi:hypothetical protein
MLMTPTTTISATFYTYFSFHQASLFKKGARRRGLQVRIATRQATPRFYYLTNKQKSKGSHLQFKNV